MIRPSTMLLYPTTVALVMMAAVACGGGSDTARNASTDGATAAASDSGTATASSEVSGADACAALPRAEIAQITGADPGEGELEHAASSTVCRYYGDTTMTVEIDPGAVVDQAQISEEAYGKTCEPFDGIGDAAIFCTSPPTGLGATGEIVWTDGEQTYYVEYNFGKSDATPAIPLQLAQALQP